MFPRYPMFLFNYYRPLANERTLNSAPVDSQTSRDFSISSDEMTSTTVILTFGQSATHSFVNLSIASKALPLKQFLVILSYMLHFYLMNDYLSSNSLPSHWQLLPKYNWSMSRLVEIILLQPRVAG